MREIFNDLKNKIKKSLSTAKDDFSDDADEEYVELDTDTVLENRRTKILVRPFVLEDFSDVKHIIDSLRDGYTICLINIRPLKNKDVVELKRAINKLKKTCDALTGDIAGFSDDWIVVTPGFAEIHRGRGAHTQNSAPQSTERIPEDPSNYDRNTVLEQYDTEDVF